jgi:hypothetical protein
MAQIAAPLLAGFSLTLVGVIAASPQNFRWPGIDIMVLVVPIVLLVACIQFGVQARGYLYSAADLKAWLPDFPLEDLKAQQAGHFDKWKKWDYRAGRTYNLAICVLALGVALTVAPSGGGARQDGFRWAASAIALAAGAAEAAWIASRLKRDRAPAGSRAAIAWERMAAGGTGRRGSNAQLPEQAEDQQECHAAPTDVDEGDKAPFDTGNLGR